MYKDFSELLRVALVEKNEGALEYLSILEDNLLKYEAKIEKSWPRHLYKPKGITSGYISDSLYPYVYMYELTKESFSKYYQPFQSYQKEQEQIEKPIKNNKAAAKNKVSSVIQKSKKQASSQKKINGILDNAIENSINENNKSNFYKKLKNIYTETLILGLEPKNFHLLADRYNLQDNFDKAKKFYIEASKYNNYDLKSLENVMHSLSLIYKSRFLDTRKQNDHTLYTIYHKKALNFKKNNLQSCQLKEDIIGGNNCELVVASGKTPKQQQQRYAVKVTENTFLFLKTSPKDETPKKNTITEKYNSSQRYVKTPRGRFSTINNDVTQEPQEGLVGHSITAFDGDETSTKITEIQPPLPCSVKFYNSTKGNCAEKRRKSYNIFFGTPVNQSAKGLNDSPLNPIPLNPII